MNANAWAALGMSVTNASRPADFFQNFPQIVSHRIRTSCFCQTYIHSSMFFPGAISQHEVCTVLQISLPEIHILYYISGQISVAAVDDSWNL